MLKSKDGRFVQRSILWLSFCWNLSKIEEKRKKGGSLATTRSNQYRIELNRSHKICSISLNAIAKVDEALMMIILANQHPQWQISHVYFLCMGIILWKSLYVKVSMHSIPHWRVIQLMPLYQQRLCEIA